VLGTIDGFEDFDDGKFKGLLTEDLKMV